MFVLSHLVYGTFARVSTKHPNVAFTDISPRKTFLAILCSKIWLSSVHCQATLGSPRSHMLWGVWAQPPYPDLQPWNSHIFAFLQAMRNTLGMHFHELFKDHLIYLHFRILQTKMYLLMLVSCKLFKVSSQVQEEEEQTAS